MNAYAFPGFKPFIVLCVSLLSILVNPAIAADPAHGKTIYQNNCQACHQAEGAGIKGAFPPLATNSNLVGDADYVARAIIKGVSGPITVGDVNYNGTMPAMAHISNEQVVDLVAYILSDLNDDDDAISKDAVQALR